ncbi:MAG: hypothetical protein ACREX8_08270 [Gammaproteobacteria bacterium]
MDREGTIKLLSAILADLPKLPGEAACRGRHRLFDELPGRTSVDERYMTAIVARVRGLDWPAAAQLADNPAGFPSARSGGPEVRP